MRTYGKLHLNDKKTHWLISGAEPHICLKLKAVFTRIKKAATQPFRFLNTPENCHDLLWFTDRYPLAISDEDLAVMKRDKKKHVNTINELEQILIPGYQPREVKLKDGFEARKYQLSGVEVYMKCKRILIGDDIGTGKTVIGIISCLHKETRPCAIVVQTHLPKQWKAQIEMFTDLTVHLIKGTKPYDLPPADIYIFKYSCLAGWSNVFEKGIFKSAIFDEIQELRHEGTAKYEGAESLSKSAEYCMGLSVAGTSIVELFGWKFGNGWVGTIEEANEIVFNKIKMCRENGYEYCDVSDIGIYTRGWNGKNFVWKSVKKFIKHNCTKDVLEIKISGRKLTVTDDHSVFYINDKKEIDYTKSSNLKISDIVPMDNGFEWKKCQELELNLIELLKENKRVQVIVDYRNLGRKYLGISTVNWNNYRIKGKYGYRLPIKEYLRLKDLLPEPKYVYVSGNTNRNRPTDAKIKISDLAFLLGFWIGDGWISLKESRVSFAVEDSFKDEFLNILKSISYFRFENIDVKKSKGKSYEIRITNHILTRVIHSIFGNVRCHNKFIPGEWITSWDKKSKLNLIDGLIMSDGCVSKSKERCYYSTTSLKLANTLLSLLRSIGITGSISEKPPRKGGIIDGRQITGKRIGYSVNWSLYETDGHKGNRHKYKKFKGQIKEGRIRSIKMLDKRPDFVYDLEMNGHPSFVCDGVLVHNSATPIYNYGNEIYNVIDIIKEDSLGDRYDFLYEWCGYNYKVVKEPQALGTYLRENFLLLRRTRSDVGRELPPINKIVHTVGYNESEVKKAEEIAKQLAIKATTGSFMERGQASRELDILVRHATGVSKAVEVAEYVKILLENNEPIVLAGWHRDVYDIWMRELKDYKPVLYTGTESPTQKEEAKRKFVSGETNLFIISLRSGIGLDGLQHRCKVVVVGELDWSPKVHDQLIGRVDREGQKEQVTAIYLVSDFGSDPLIIDMLGIKSSQSHNIINPLTAVEEQFSDDSRIKLLAEKFLEKKVAEKHNSEV